MESKESWKILKIYISEDSKYNGHNLYRSLVQRFREIGMAGTTVTRGIEGFGHEKRLHSTKIISISSSLPIIVEVIDKTDMIEKAASEAKKMVNEGLIIITDINLIKYGNRLF